MWLVSAAWLSSPSPPLQLGVYTAEAALGVYLRERLAAAQALCRLLSLQLFNGVPTPGGSGGFSPGGAEDGEAAPPPLLAAVVVFNSELLAAKEGAGPGGAPGAQRNALIGAILDVLQVGAGSGSGPGAGRMGFGIALGRGMQCGAAQRVQWRGVTLAVRGLECGLFSFCLWRTGVRCREPQFPEKSKAGRHAIGHRRSGTSGWDSLRQVFLRPVEGCRLHAVGGCCGPPPCSCRFTRRAFVACVMNKCGAAVWAAVGRWLGSRWAGK